MLNLIKGQALELDLDRMLVIRTVLPYPCTYVRMYLVLNGMTKPKEGPRWGYDSSPRK